MSVSRIVEPFDNQLRTVRALREDGHSHRLISDFRKGNIVEKRGNLGNQFLVLFSAKIRKAELGLVIDNFHQKKTFLNNFNQ